MSDHEATLHLSGETVTVSYLADPAVGHGEFRIENRGNVSARVSVDSAWLELGGREQTLDDITVYHREKGRTLNPADFTVEAGEAITFLLGFPEVKYEPRFGESTSVGVQLRSGGAELRALSRIKFVRRIPRGD